MVWPKLMSQSSFPQNIQQTLGPGSIQCFRLFWQDHCLNPNAKGPRVDVSDSSLSELIHQIWGPLTWGQLILLAQSLGENPSRPQKLNWSQLLELSQFQPHERNVALLTHLSPMDPAFLTWVHERKASPQDLMPLKSLQPKDLNHSQWSHWQDLNATRHQGRQLIDLIVDITLIDEQLPHWDEGDQAAKLLVRLQQQRYPQQNQWDQQKLAAMAKEGWPRFTRVRSERQGDQLRHHMQLSFDNLNDLQQKLDRLKDHISQQHRPI